jgi:hypothetical protein
MTTQFYPLSILRSTVVRGLSLLVMATLASACGEPSDDAVELTPTVGSQYAGLNKATTTKVQFRYQGVLEEPQTLCLAIAGFEPVAMNRTPSKFTLFVRLPLPGDFTYHYFASDTSDCTNVGGDVWPGPAESMVTAGFNVPLETGCAPRAGGGSQVNVTIDGPLSPTYTGTEACPAPAIARVLIYAQDFVEPPTASQTVCVEVEGEGVTALSELNGRYRYYVEGVDFDSTRDYRFFVSGTPSCSTIVREVYPTDATVAVEGFIESACTRPAAAADELWYTLSVDAAGAATPGSVGACERFDAEAKQVANHSDGDTDVADELGTAIATFGDRVLVGADRSDRFNRYGGAAYVYRQDVSGWVQEAVLNPVSAAEWDRLGAAVALSEDTAAVGLWQRAPAGAVAVFERTGTTWAESVLLTPPDGQTRDGFGERLAIDGDHLVVGAYQADRGANADEGAAYIYENDGGWQHAVTLSRSGTAGASHRFGFSVAIDGDVAVVGAPGEGSGAVYVYRQGAGGWAEEARLVAPDGVAVGAFGTSVDVDGTRIAAGSIGGAGLVVIYEFDGTSWASTAVVESATSGATGRFGDSLSLEADTLAVGAFRSSITASRAGSVHVFTLAGGIWGGEQVFTAADSDAGDRYGLAVDLHFGRLVVTGPRDDEAGTNSGAFYVYE